MTASAPRLEKLVVIGVGLIGGSFALALKSAGAVKRVIGVGRGSANLADAQRLGIIDRAITLDGPWMDELADADVVLMATPVAQAPMLFAAMAGRLGPRGIVTDAGSTKQDVIEAARATPGFPLPRFVPGHPIAGTEHSGAAAAFATLYNDRNVVLAPLPETDPQAIATITALWEACGASVRTLDAAAHDRVFAAVSHLPHVLAFALVDAFASRADAEDIFRFAASGFRDFTRIAASSPEMWRDVAIGNRDALQAEIAAFRAQLDRVAAMIAKGDAAALEGLFANARAARRRWDAERGANAASLPADAPRAP